MSWLHDYAESILTDSTFTYPIQLDVPLTLDQVYVPLLVNHTKEDDEARGLRAFKPNAASQQSVMEKPPAEYLSAVEMVNRERRLILLGDEGQGKTTFLKYLTLCLLGVYANQAQYSPDALRAAVHRKADSTSLEMQQWDDDAILPIYLDLKRITERFASIPDSVPSFWKMIAAIYPLLQGQPFAKMQKLVLIDHTEILEDRYWALWLDLIKTLSADDDTLRVVLTSSHADYRKRPVRPEGFIEERLIPFTVMQKSMVLEKVLADGISSGQEQKVSDLPSNPLQLTLCCLAGGEAHEMQQVMHRLNARYLQKYGIQQNIASTCTLDIGKLAFEHLLTDAPIQEKDVVAVFQKCFAKRNSTPEPELKKTLSSDRYLFQAIDGNTYTFRHPLLRDTYIAQYLQQTHFPDLYLSTVKRAPFKWEMVSKNLYALLAYQKDGLDCKLADLMLSDVETKMDESQGMLAYLVAESLRESLERLPESLVNRIRFAMQQILIQGWLSPFERDQAGRFLSVLGDHRDLKELITIPAGEIFLGNNFQANSSPEHRIAHSEFKIGRYPVTIGFYREFAEETQRNWVAKDSTNSERQNAPAVDVTWHDALDFCAWLTKKWQTSGRIAKDEVVRLPTEVEWESAARGKRSLADSPATQLIYPWGVEWQEDCCNSLEMGFNDTCVVGMFPQGASPYGCLDMCGQVWEWTTTLWGKKMDRPDIPFPYQFDDGRENLQADEATRRVLRGGSFSSPSQKTSCTYRGSLEPGGFWRGDGFRIVVAKR